MVSDVQGSLGPYTLRISECVWGGNATVKRKREKPNGSDQVTVGAEALPGVSLAVSLIPTAWNPHFMGK